MLDGAESARHPLASGRRAYVHVARGSIEVNGTRLGAGDAAKLTDEGEVKLDGVEHIILTEDDVLAVVG